MTRNVLVTGGATGIGLAIAERFVAAGDTVYLTGRRPRALADAVAALGPAARSIQCDNTSPAQLQAALDQLPARLHVLVNNAGGNTDLNSAAPDTLAGLAERWLANLATNLLSAVLTTHAVTDRLVEGAAVVSVGSIAAEYGAAGYGAAKSALTTWNVELAGQLGPRGITCNVVSPGYVADTEFFRDRLTEQRRDTLVARTLTGRAGTPADIAGAVFFLAVPDARHVTGQVLNVNGGSHPTR